MWTLLECVYAHTRLGAGRSMASVSCLTVDRRICASGDRIACVVRAAEPVVADSRCCRATTVSWVAARNRTSVGILAIHVLVAARAGRVLGHSVAEVVSAEIPVVAVSCIDAAIRDCLTRASSRLIANVSVGTRVAVVAAVARLRSVRATVCRVAKLIFRASVTIVAIDRRTFAW